MRKTLILFIFALLCTWITSFHLGKRTTSLYLNRRQEAAKPPEEAAGAAEKKVEEKKEEKKEDKPEEKKLEEKKPEEKKPEEKKPEEKKPEEKKEDKPEEKKPEEKKPEEKKPEEKKPEEKKPEEKKPEEKKPEEKKPEEKKPEEKKPEEKKDEKKPEETGGLDMKLLAEAFHLTRDCCEKCYQRNICIPAGFCVDHNGRCLTPAVVNCLAARSGCTEHCMRAFFKQDLPLLKELIASDYNGGKLKPVECQVGKEKDS